MKSVKLLPAEEQGEKAQEQKDSAQTQEQKDSAQTQEQKDSENVQEQTVETAQGAVEE